MEVERAPAAPGGTSRLLPAADDDEVDDEGIGRREPGLGMPDPIGRAMREPLVEGGRSPLVRPWGGAVAPRAGGC